MRIKSILTSLTITVLLASLAVPFSMPARADKLGDRALRLSDSKAGELDVTYRFSFAYAQAAAVGSVEFELCSNDPFIGTACTAPAGLDASGAVLSSQSGETGYSIHPNSTANRIILTRSASVVTPQSAVYTFTNITNPSGGGSYYVRLATFNSDDATGPRIDDGGIAFMINGGLGVSTEVPPYLTFCVAVTITSSCANASGDQLNFGDLSTASPKTATSQFYAATNAEMGYNVTVSGTTLTSGNKTIRALSNGDISKPGTSQFGINLRDNSDPNVGKEPSGPGSASPVGKYATANQFAFKDGDVIATSTGTAASRLFTASYIINIGNNQAAGVYTATLSYICLASF